MYSYLIKSGLILKSILWYGRMGLILIQPLYMIGLSIFPNLSAWASVGRSLRRKTNAVWPIQTEISQYRLFTLFETILGTNGRVGTPAVERRVRLLR